MRKLWIPWFLLLVGWMVVGCGGGKSPSGVRLAGRVTLYGQPLPPDAEGRIRFMPASAEAGHPVEASLVNSQYQVKNVPKGKLVVLFYITRRTNQLRIDLQSPEAYPKEEIWENLVPERYRQGIPIEVLEDNLQLNFDLQ